MVAARDYSRLTGCDPEELTSNETSLDGEAQTDQLPWLELLSASQKGEELRKEARELTRKYHDLHDGATRFHALQHRACIKEELTKKMFKLDALAEDDHAKRRPILVEIQDMLRQEQALESFTEELPTVSDELARLLDFKQAGKVGAETAVHGRQMIPLTKGSCPTMSETIRDALEKHNGEASLKSRYDAWVSELNELTPMKFVEIATVLSVEDGQEHLNDFIQSLSLELAWPTAEKRFRYLVHSGFESDEKWKEVDNTEWKRQMGQDFHLLGYDPGCEKPSNIYYDPGCKKPADEYYEEVAEGLQEELSREDEERWEHSKRRLGFDEPRGLTDVRIHFWNKLFFGETCAVFSASFCVSPAVQLLSPSDKDLTLVLKTLVDMGHFSYGFVTPVGRAILELACERSSYIRRTHAVKDFLFVFVLVFMGHSLRESNLDGAPECPEWTLHIFLILSVLVAFNYIGKLIIEVALFVSSAGPCKFDGIVQGVFAAMSKHATTWSVLVGAAELFSIWVSVRFIYTGIIWNGNSDLHESIKSSFDYFKENPATMSGLVLIRWTIFSTSFLQLEQVGRNMVPVVIAVTQPASLFFLFFLGFMILAAFHAYYVYPIQENVGDHARWVDNYVFNTFLKIFRLTVLGDFDLAELEGLDDKIHAKLNRSSSFITGAVDVDSEDWTDQYHRAVRYQFVILSLVITVVVMNVYIGLLGELYEAAEKRSRQLYNHYRASCAYRHMCERSALTWILCGCCHSSDPERKAKGLYWFIFKKKQLTDDEEAKKISE